MDTGALLLDFFQRYDPNLRDKLRGCDAAEIERLEVLSGATVPPLHRYLLEQMGGDLGPLAWPMVDFTVAGVIAAYEDEEGEPDDNHILLGVDKNPLDPIHLYLETDPKKEKGGAVTRESCGPPEMLTKENIVAVCLLDFWARHGFDVLRVTSLPKRREGVLRYHGGANPDAAAELDALLTQAGFTRFDLTSERLRLYDREDAAVAMNCSLRQDPNYRHVADFAARDRPTLVLLLEVIQDNSAWRFVAL